MLRRECLGHVEHKRLQNPHQCRTLNDKGIEFAVDCLFVEQLLAFIRVTHRYSYGMA